MTFRMSMPKSSSRPPTSSSRVQEQHLCPLDHTISSAELLSGRAVHPTASNAPSLRVTTLKVMPESNRTVSPRTVNNPKPAECCQRPCNASMLSSKGPSTPPSSPWQRPWCRFAAPFDFWPSSVLSFSFLFCPGAPSSPAPDDAAAAGRALAGAGATELAAGAEAWLGVALACGREAETPEACAGLARRCAPSAFFERPALTGADAAAATAGLSSPSEEFNGSFPFSLLEALPSATSPTSGCPSPSEEEVEL
mmetsp:Transcript_91343/g.257951  ORF Transcript_91343/g.257951 Transcript_91343/m.257951 type:complete len:252 (+) Transcript_91343:1836-2591(+)